MPHYGFYRVDTRSKTPPHYAENITKWCRTGAVLVPRCQSRESALTPFLVERSGPPLIAISKIDQTKHIQRGEKKKKISISNEHAILCDRDHDSSVVLSFLFLIKVR